MIAAALRDGVVPADWRELVWERSEAYGGSIERPCSTALAPTRQRLVNPRERGGVQLPLATPHHLPRFLLVADANDGTRHRPLAQDPGNRQVA